MDKQKCVLVLLLWQCAYLSLCPWLSESKLCKNAVVARYETVRAVGFLISGKE